MNVLNTFENMGKCICYQGDVPDVCTEQLKRRLVLFDSAARNP
jgi:hypothetical protein